jgi:hypothetical protein
VETATISGSHREGVSYAYFKVFELTAALGACMNWRFIQLKKAKTTEKKASEEKKQIQPTPGQDPDAWSTDSVEDSSDPAYPKTGNQAMVDTPGWFVCSITPDPVSWNAKSTDAEYVSAESDFNRIVSKEAFPRLCK